MRHGLASLGLVCLISASLLLSGCSEKSEIKYSDRESVLKEQSSIPDLKLDNLILPDKVMKVETDKFYTFVSKVDHNGPTKEHKERLKELITDFSGSYNESKEFDEEDGCHYDDENCAAFVSTTDSFGIYLRVHTPGSEDKVEVVQKTETVKIIHVDRGESTDVTYNVGGEDLPLNEAIRIAEEGWKKAGLKDKVLRQGEDYKLKYVIIKKHTFSDRVEYCYYLYWSITINGVPLVETGGSPNPDAFPFNTFAKASFEGRPDLTELTLECYVDTSGLKEYTGKLVTLESALKKASNYLAAYKKYTVPEVGMVYCAIAAGHNYTELDYRPMWRIILEEEQLNCNDRQPVLALYIDMTNGDMYMFDDRRGEMLGIKKGDE